MRDIVEGKLPEEFALRNDPLHPAPDRGLPDPDAVGECPVPRSRRAPQLLLRHTNPEESKAVNV